MKPFDLPLLYRAALIYCPEIKTFRGERGAWRVHHCFESSEHWPFCGIRVFPVEEHQDGEATKMLYMDVPHMLRSNTFVNPTGLLRELFAQKAGRRLDEFYLREMNL